MHQMVVAVELSECSMSQGDHNPSRGWMFDFWRDGNFFKQEEESWVLKVVGLLWHASKGAQSGCADCVRISSFSFVYALNVISLHWLNTSDQNGNQKA